MCRMSTGGGKRPRRAAATVTKEASSDSDLASHDTANTVDSDDEQEQSSGQTPLVTNRPYSQVAALAVKTYNCHVGSCRYSLCVHADVGRTGYISTTGGGRRGWTEVQRVRQKLRGLFHGTTSCTA